MVWCRYKLHDSFWYLLIKWRGGGSLLRVLSAYFGVKRQQHDICQPKNENLVDFILAGLVSLALNPFQTW